MKFAILFIEYSGFVMDISLKKIFTKTFKFSFFIYATYNKYSSNNPTQTDITIPAILLIKKSKLDKQTKMNIKIYNIEMLKYT